LWFPWNVLSRITSRHHKIEINTIKNKLINDIKFILKFIIIILEIIKLKVLIAIKIGHGLKFKIKYGWFIFIIIH
jgi:hypothetical protein